MTRPRGPAAALDPDAEHLWDRLRAEFQLHDGFWLAILFGAQTVELTELIGRTRDLASVQVAEVQELRITSADDIGRVLRELLTPARPGVLATWLLDDPIARPEVRREWWSSLLRRLNERRDALRAARPGALILACPPDALGLVRDEAPDLWSYRSLTASLQASRSVSVELEHSAAPQAADAAGRTAEPPAPLSPAIAEQVRQVARALRSDRLDAALTAAQRAVEASRTPSDRAVADAWLARVRSQQGDEAEALRLARRAWSSGQALEEATAQALLEILITSPVLTERTRAALDLVDLAREAVARTPDSPDSWRDLSIALDHVGGVQQDRGDLAAALTAFTESLDLRRRLAEQYGSTPQALRDLSVSLDKIGKVQQDQGDLHAALTAFTESLELSRRLAEQYGNTPQALRDLSISLDSVGAVQQDHGDLDAALTAFTESLELSRRLADQYGNTPEALRDLSISLESVGGVQRELGDLHAALTAFTESLELRRRLAEQYGNTPGALRGLSISLEKVGQVQQDQGDLHAALTAFTESLELSRKLTEQYGTAPQALRDLSISLNKVGQVQQDQGDLNAALAAFTESLDLRRRLAEQYDTTPQALRDLSISLDYVGQVYEQQGDLADANRAYAEGIIRCSELNHRYPGLLDNDRLLEHLMASAARTADDQGSPTG
jgi:tetratricopeptide (TPR) repeat protein